MGNRGCLHDANGNIVRKSAISAWVSCRIDFKGVRRQVLKPGVYTELFFLDEATALAAGHSPCYTCRRHDAGVFAKFWASSNLQRETARAPEIDAILSRERSTEARIQVESVISLPDGIIVQHEASGIFYLLHQGKALQWSFEGYRHPVAAISLAGPLRIMTPASIVRALRAGYKPQIHPSTTPPAG